MKILWCLITVNLLLVVTSATTVTPPVKESSANLLTKDNKSQEVEKKEIRKRGIVGGHHGVYALPRTYAAHYGHSYYRNPTLLKATGGVHVKTLTPLFTPRLPYASIGSLDNHFLRPAIPFAGFNYAPQFLHRPIKPLVTALVKPLHHLPPVTTTTSFAQGFPPALYPFHAYQPHFTPTVVHLQGHPATPTTGTVDCPPLSGVSHVLPGTSFTPFASSGTNLLHTHFPTVPLAPFDPSSGVVPSLPALPQPPVTIPEIPVLPGLPAFPALPSYPELPALPAIPQPPALPELPPLPQIPAIPNANGFVSSHFQPPPPQQPPLFFNVVVPANKKPDIIVDIAPPQHPPAPLPVPPQPVDEPIPQPQPPQFEPHPVYGPPISSQQPSHTLLPPHGSSPDNGEFI